MCRGIEEAELVRGSPPHAMLVVPRGTYKSSIAIAAITWKMLRQIHVYGNLYHRIVLASATLALGNAAMRSVQGTWQYGGKNQRIDTDFGKLWQNRSQAIQGSVRPDGLVHGPRALAGEIAEIKEPSIFVGSLRRLSTGFHADEAIVDDLNNKDNVKTDHQRKLTHTYYRLLYPILGTEDRAGNPTKMTMLCTPWHDDDVRGMIIREEVARLREKPDAPRKWNVLHRGAILEDGSPFFPTKYPLDRLEELRILMGAREFAANYECDPVGSSGFVDEELIKFQDVDSARGGLSNGRITVDPNQHKDAKEMGCWCAIVVSAFDRFGKMYVLDLRGSREWGTAEFIRALFDVQADYPDFPIHMEDSHMTHFEHAVRLEEARLSAMEGRVVRLRIHYVPVDYKTSKYERWTRVQPRFANRSIVFSDSIRPSLKAEMKDELVRGEAARFKDFLDALAMAETGYRPRIGKDGQALEMKVPAAFSHQKPTPFDPINDHIRRALGEYDA